MITVWKTMNNILMYIKFLDSLNSDDSLLEYVLSNYSQFPEIIQRIQSSESSQKFEEECKKMEKLFSNDEKLNNLLRQYENIDLKHGGFRHGGFSEPDTAVNIGRQIANVLSEHIREKEKTTNEQ